MARGQAHRGAGPGGAAVRGRGGARGARLHVRRHAEPTACLPPAATACHAEQQPATINFVVILFSLSSPTAVCARCTQAAHGQAQGSPGRRQGRLQSAHCSPRCGLGAVAVEAVEATESRAARCAAPGQELMPRPPATPAPRAAPCQVGANGVESSGRRDTKCVCQRTSAALEKARSPRRLRNHTRFPFQLGQRPTWCARASHLFFSPLKIRLLWREPLVSAPRGSRPPRCPPRGRRAAPWWRAARASPRTPSGLGTPSASRQLAELQMVAARHHTRHCARHTPRALLAQLAPSRRGAPAKPWVGQPARHACMLALVLPTHTALATGHRAAKAERFSPVLRCSAKCLWSMQRSEVITF